MNGKSRLQFSADGTATLGGVGFGRPSDTFEDREPLFDWLQALSLPKDWEQLDRLSEYQGFSDRFLRCVIADESPTRFAGAPRLRPQWYQLPAQPIGFALAHLGFVIGVVWAMELKAPHEVPETEWHCLLGSVRFLDSELAHAAWQGIQRGIFRHVCGVLKRQGDEPFGSGELLEVALIDRPGCQRWLRLFGQSLPIHKWRLAVRTYAAEGCAGRLSQYTRSGVRPSSARCGLI